MTNQFNWARRNGYEVSSKGDSRFSAFNALMPDNRSLECHYQCDVKAYDPGGSNWRLGKSKPPLGTVDLWAAYLALWRTWAALNLPLMRELYVNASKNNYTLSDCFASTPINQANALATILNELVASALAK